MDFYLLFTVYIFRSLTYACNFPLKINSEKSFVYIICDRIPLLTIPLLCIQATAFFFVHFSDLLHVF